MAVQVDDVVEIAGAAALGQDFIIPWTTRTCFQFAADIADYQKHRTKRLQRHAA